MRKTYLYKLGCTYILYMPLGWGFFANLLLWSLPVYLQICKWPSFVCSISATRGPRHHWMTFCITLTLGDHWNVSQKLVVCSIRRHGHDVYLGMSSIKMVSHMLMYVLASFGAISQTSNKVWMSSFQRSEQDKHTQRRCRVRVRAEHYSLLLPKFFSSSFPSNFARS